MILKKLKSEVEKEARTKKNMRIRNREVLDRVRGDGDRFGCISSEILLVKMVEAAVALGKGKANG